MFLDFHHEVVDVDQLPSDGEALEWVLGEHLLEPVVVLNQLRQGPLWTFRKKIRERAPL